MSKLNKQERARRYADATRASLYAAACECARTEPVIREVLEQANTALQTAIDGANGDIASLQEELGTFLGRVEELKGEIENIAKMRDSYKDVADKTDERIKTLRGQLDEAQTVISTTAEKVGVDGEQLLEDAREEVQAQDTDVPSPDPPKNVEEDEER